MFAFRKGKAIMLLKKNSVVQRSIILSLVVMNSMAAKESEKWISDHVKIAHVGNFALPLSQQPAPLFSFGQNLVDKHDFLAFINYNQLKGPRSNFIDMVPSILYGVTDTLSLFVELPIAAKFMHEGSKSHGVSDLIVQLEQIVYAVETPVSVNEITAVGHMSFPTGSFEKTPSTGFGSPTFFLGVTLSRYKPDWYYFSSFGGLITTMYKNHKIGNLFFYQFGVGRNIAYKTDGWILNWMVELDGTYKQRDKVCNIIDPNSGSNTIIIGPSIFFSTQRFEMDGGIAVVADQHLFGRETRDHFFASFYAGWKF
jgi:hypothetical protein